MYYVRESRTIPFRGAFTQGQLMLRRVMEGYIIYHRLLTYRQCGLHVDRNIDSVGKHYRRLWDQKKTRPWQQNIADHGIPCPRMYGPLHGAAPGDGTGICLWHICRDMAVYYTIMDVNLDYRNEEIVQNYRDQNQAPAPLPIERYRHSTTVGGDLYLLTPTASEDAARLRQQQYNARVTDLRRERH